MRHNEPSRARLSRATRLALIGIAVLVAEAVLVASVVVTVAAWKRERVEAGTAESDQDRGALLAPQGALEGELRSLPLRSPSDPVGAAFPNGLTDETEVSEMLVELATPIGLGDDILWLADLELDQEGGSYAMIGGPSRGGLPVYPYEYLQVDPVVSAAFDMAAARADPDMVVDLAALLTVAAATSWEQPGSFSSGAVVAYSLLRHALATNESCDLQLQLAYVTSLGQWVADENLSREVETARRLCPGDPTPLWIRSQSRVGYALGEDLMFRDRLGATQLELMEGADEDFETLRTDFRDSPVGWAGWADALMDRADISERRGLRPFQVRSWRRESLHLYEEARSKSTDPALLVGHARSLTAAGEYDRARSVIGEASSEDGNLLSFVVTKVRNDQAAGDFLNVVDTLDRTQVQFPTGLEMTRGNYLMTRLPGYGRIATAGAIVADASIAEAGGANTRDVAFIPEHRTDWSATGRCLEIDAINALVIEGRKDEAKLWHSSSFSTPVHPVHGSCSESQNLSAIVSTDARQDLFRWANRMNDADDVVSAWRAEHPNDYAADQRAGEIAYLSGDYAAAAEYFQTSLGAWIQASGSDGGVSSESFTDLDLVRPRDVLELQLAAALAADGDRDGARETLAALVDRLESSSPDDEQLNHDAALFYARSQVGSLSLEEGDFSGAEEDLRSAVGTAKGMDSASSALPGMEEGEAFVLLRGSQENNLALALARNGEPEEAVAMAEAALTRDPASPIFLDTLAFAHQLGGDPGEAVQAYKKALAADATSYVSANNLAVLLAEQGDYEQARGVLRDALAVSPGYAKAWHNLGVVESRLGHGFIDTQGAFAAAGRLSRPLRGEDSVLLVDETIYNSGLDISKALSPNWSYVQTAHRPGAGFVISMLLIILVRLGWVLGLDRAFEWLASILMAGTPGIRNRWSWMWRQAPTALALAMSAVVLAIPAIRWSINWSDRGFFVLCMGALVLVPVYMRKFLAWPQAVPQFGWLPAVVTGGIFAPFGITIAPFPGIDDSAARQRGVAWAAAVTVAVTTVVFAVLAFVSAVPLARFMAMAGVALLASILLPIPPFDGKRLMNRPVGLAVTFGLGFATVAFAANWI